MTSEAQRLLPKIRDCLRAAGNESRRADCNEHIRSAIGMIDLAMLAHAPPASGDPPAADLVEQAMAPEPCQKCDGKGEIYLSRERFNVRCIPCGACTLGRALALLDNFQEATSGEQSSHDWFLTEEHKAREALRTFLAAHLVPQKADHDQA